MQFSSKRVRLVAPLLVLAMGAAACGGGDSDDNAAQGGGGSGASGGTFSIQIGQPENPLVPGNTTESEGNQVLESLFTGLIEYNVDTSEAEFTGVAESIESEDQTTWTVKLKPGWTFHDGTPVDSQSFVDAWNFTALSTNANDSSYFFSNVEGYDALQAETNDAGDIVAQPTATTMTGLKVVSPTEFTVTLTAPYAQYPLTVGYTAFYPLPKAFFADQKAFGEKPIGNGPFKADQPFVEGRGFTVTRFDGYAGEKAKADAVEFRVYQDFKTAYTDAQAGNLDIVPEIPPGNIATFKTDFPDRFGERESSSFTYMGFPLYDPRFQDKRVRQAFSMAIDRQAITEAIFQGTRAPAYGAVSPVVDGAREDACQYCKFDPQAAKDLLAQTGFDVSQPVNLWFNSGAGHDEWVEAVGNQLRTNLGIEYSLQGQLDFSEYLPTAEEKGFTGPFRLGWSMDYPSMENYLGPLHTKGAFPPAGSNSAFYDNPAFDAKVQEGNEAAENADAITAYQEAEDLLLEDMPIMPMFFGKTQTVYSPKVSNVKVDAFVRVDLASVTVNQ